MSLFSYDAILIKEDGIETEICQVIAIIRTLTYVPILAIANIEFEEIKKIVYAGCDIIVSENYSDNAISIQLWALARRYRKWNKEKDRQNTIIKKGKLVMEREQQKINWNGIELHLTRREYDFLYLLASSPRRIYTFEQIYQLVWKDYPAGDTKNIIWCLVKRLRKKLNVVEAGAGNCIVSVRDIGYKFELNKENEQQ